MKEPYVINLKKPEDSPEQIASKLNSLTGAINVEVIAGALPREEFNNYKAKNDKIVGGYEDRVNYNTDRGTKKLTDMRYHGAGSGLAFVTTDATLTGNGTPASPLHATTTGSGTVTSVSVITDNGFQGTVASATTTPAITLSTDVTHYLPTTTDQTNWNAKGVGTVTSVSIVTTNGLAGTVASATTTPAITLSTTVNGILKGNATAISAATADVDYLTPTTATGTYLTIALATSTYLPLSVATSTYLPLSVATAIYLPLSVATSVYLSQSLATATYLSLASAAATYITTGSTNTLTNKRITKRVNLISGSATYSFNTDLFDVIHATGQAVTITSITASGTPIDGDTLRFSITATGSCALTLATSNFESSTIALPTTTSSTTRLDLGFLWNTETSHWRIVALS